MAQIQKTLNFKQHTIVLEYQTTEKLEASLLDINRFVRKDKKEYIYWS